MAEELKRCRVVKLPDEHELVKDVAKRWKAQYCHLGAWGRLIEGSSEAIYNNLVALGDDLTPERALAIVGNCGWVSMWCDGCKTWRLGGAAQIGDPPDYESATVTLCPDCARQLARDLTELYPSSLTREDA